MKWIVLLLLIGLYSCHSRAQSPAAGSDWVTTIADQLYERQLLNKTGRDELKQHLHAARLSGIYTLPGTARYGQLPAAAPAAVLQFCAQAFQAAQLQRSVVLTERQQQQLRTKPKFTLISNSLINMF